MLNAFAYLQYLAARLRPNDRGATAVEYGLIVALIAAVISAAAFALGGDISTLLHNIDQAVNGNGPPKGP